MTMHLIESTIVLAVVLLIARTPRLSAQTRHAIVFAALVKFAMPSAIVARIIERFGATGATLNVTMIRTARAFAAAAAPRGSAMLVLRIVWLVIAAALLLRAFTLSRRVAKFALQDATPASARELAVLARIGARQPVVLLRSPHTAAPAVIGMFLPTIVIPPSSDDLSDEELESILAHECAHIARRDNLLGIIETLLASALWFHPLVWFARRELARHREEACDAAAASGRPQTYVHALATIGAAAINPRVSAVSCIATASLKERMKAIMTLESKRLPHRLIVPIAILLIAAFTIAAGAATAQKPKQYTGEKISLNLKDADLRDVLNTFGKLSGLNMNIDADVQGKVTVDFRDVPWDEAFDIIVHQNNLEWQATGDTVHVFR